MLTFIMPIFFKRHVIVVMYTAYTLIVVITITTFKYGVSRHVVVFSQSDKHQSRHESYTKLAADIAHT